MTQKKKEDANVVRNLAIGIPAGDKLGKNFTADCMAKRKSSDPIRSWLGEKRWIQGENSQSNEKYSEIYWRSKLIKSMETNLSVRMRRSLLMGY